MSIQSVRMSGLAVLLCASIALAQTPPKPNQPTDQPKVDKPDRERRPRPMARGASAEVQLKALTEQLQLDELQRAEVAKLLEAQQVLIRDVRRQNQRTPEEIEAWRQIKEDMDAAMQAGDKAKMEELRLKSQDMHKARRERIAPALQQLEQAEQTVHDDVAKLLRPDQIEKFETVWKERKLARGARNGPVRNPRALKDIVERLPDLSAEQKTQVSALFDEYQKSLREASKTETGDSQDAAQRNREARQKLYRERQEKLFDDVIAILTPEQKASIEKALKGKSRRPGRENRRDKEHESEGRDALPR